MQGSDGSNNPNPDDDLTAKVQKAIADYEAYSEPIAYALFALAFLQLCRFLSEYTAKPPFACTLKGLC